MPVHVDETLPLHPLTVADVEAMVRAGILDEDDHVELLDGVLVEMGATSLAIDLVRKARIYATGGVPEYWVLDLERCALVVHREPNGGVYVRVRTLGEAETITLPALDLAVPVSSLL